MLLLASLNHDEDDDGSDEDNDESYSDNDTYMRGERELFQTIKG